MQITCQLSTVRFSFFLEHQASYQLSFKHELSNVNIQLLSFIFNHVLFDWEVWLSEGAVDGALDVTQSRRCECPLNLRLGKTGSRP